MNTKPTPVTRTRLAFAQRRLAPHSLVFLAFNGLYLLPVIALFLFNYSEGGTVSAADMDANTATKTTLTYLAGVSAFLLGSRVVGSRQGGKVSPNRRQSLRLFDINFAFWLVCGAVITALLISKFLLVPMGVYSQYAFDTESMTGGMWTFSMFCSESLLLLSIVALFSTARHNLRWFFALSAINGVNLLHGTRMFFMIAGVAFCFYAYLRRKLNWRGGITAAAASLALGYFIFLMRSNAFLDTDTFSLAKIVSPIMYESIFSQLALFEVIRNPHLWGTFGAPLNLLTDATYFLVPRFLLPSKDQMLFLDRFSDLSPLGAFSGYAQGLIYFGLLFPCFYFVLGRLASWLYHKAEISSLGSVLYVYFVCDFLFRIMRDGYIIPIKMLIDGIVILGLVVILDRGLFLNEARSR